MKGSLAASHGGEDLSASHSVDHCLFRGMPGGVIWHIIRKSFSRRALLEFVYRRLSPPSCSRERVKVRRGAAAQERHLGADLRFES